MTTNRSVRLIENVGDCGNQLEKKAITRSFTTEIMFISEYKMYCWHLWTLL